MRSLPRTFLVLVVVLLLSPAACSPAPTPPPVTTSPAPTDTRPPTHTYTPSSTHTPEPTSTPTSTSTPDLKLAATPTIPDGWATPGFAYRENDYMYYSQLLVDMDDSNPPVLITGPGAVARVGCPTCEMTFGRYVYALHTEQNVKVTLIIMVYRFPNMTALQEKLEADIAEGSSHGFTQVQAPSNIQLPPETVLFVAKFGDDEAVEIITAYGVFEIIAQQDQPNELPIEANIEFFSRLAELQISKLQKAGY